MQLSNVRITNFRSLRSVTVPLERFAVLIGENDVGKTSFLTALERFFAGKKIDSPDDWFQQATGNPISIEIVFTNLPEDSDLVGLRRLDNRICIRRTFEFDKPPITKAILDDDKHVDVPKGVAGKWFSNDNFHLVPVRRDLAVQFSMNKTALLGKLLRQRIRMATETEDAKTSLEAIQQKISSSLSEPRNLLAKYLKQQLKNDSVALDFDNLAIDPTEGVSFDVRMSDDKSSSIRIENRGAGTQNHAILALFRLIAELRDHQRFVLAMEEPENSLHPKAQRQLLSVLQEIGQSTQVIVTTHSPVFIDRSRYESNILLTRSPKGDATVRVFDPQMITEVRTDLGIRVSDALLKGGGNCALLVEGKTEEEAFPIFMEMMGLSEFALGITIISMDGCDFPKARGIAQLLHAYEIPCVIVLDRDASDTEANLNKVRGASLPNIRQVFRLQQGVVEDYYPLTIVADVMNSELSPSTPIHANDFDATKSGDARLKDFKRVMFEHGAGESIERMKQLLGDVGTKAMQKQALPVPLELRAIFECVQKIVAT